MKLTTFWNVIEYHDDFHGTNENWSHGRESCSDVVQNLKA